MTNQNNTPIKRRRLYKEQSENSVLKNNASIENQLSQTVIIMRQMHALVTKLEHENQRNTK
jgi:hypothetical protein